MRSILPALLVALGCGYGDGTGVGGGNGGTGGGRATTITVGNDFFSPTPDTVSAGVVTFSWVTPSNGHTLTWDSGPGTLPANTGTISTGTRLVTLQAGTYQYHCALHGGPGTGMHGTIVAE
ncbi:MAG: cupredoxin domain-containing protein [Gemmatimonadales bacterium]